jgi:hypothetical protein
MVIDCYQSLFGKVTDSAEKEHDQGESEEHESCDWIHILVLDVPVVLLGLHTKIEHYYEAQDEGRTLDATES